MGRSLKSAKAVLECLRTHPLGLVLGGGATSGRPQDRLPICSSRMSCTWLKTDEHALAGGLASKLSDAEGRAIKLLTPPKPIDADPADHAAPADPGKKWVQVGTGKKDRLTAKDWQATAEELLQKLEENPRYRLTSNGRWRRSRNERGNHQSAATCARWSRTSGKRDKDALAVGLHVTHPWQAPDEVEFDVRQGPGRAGRHRLPSP